VGQEPSDDAAPLTEKELAAMGYECPCGQHDAVCRCDEVASLLAHVRVQAEEIARRRDAMFRGHAGLSCADVGKMIDRSLTRAAQTLDVTESVRGVVGAREDETTVDAARRVVAERDAWRSRYWAERAARAHRKDSREGLAAADRYERAVEELRAFGIDPDADPSAST
jgi:hypothetical protein